MTTALLLLLAAYLIGSVPTSYVVGRVARGIDLREHGSGNLGTTNVLRVLGWRFALPVLLVDVAKGWVPTALFPAWDGRASADWALAYGSAAVLGHVFSIWVRFRGGKGVATGAGVFLALAPAALFIGLVIWATLVWATRIVSVASIAAALALPGAVAATQGVSPVFWLAIALAAFVLYSHRSNLRRLFRGEERRIGRGAEGIP